jgi:hypothetical protein
LQRSRSNPFREIVNHRIDQRIKTSILLNIDDYRTLHGDLHAHGVDDLYGHYLRCGLSEQRQTFTASTIARVLGEIDREYATYAEEYLARFEAAQSETAKHDRFNRSQVIGVIYHSMANHFMHPIAVTLAHALRRAGARCMLVTELDPYPEAITCPIVIAPHEFFIFPVPEYYRSAEFLTKCIVFNTEQLPSPWFRIGLETLYSAKAVVDVNFQSAIVLSSAMPAAYFLPPFNGELRDRYVAKMDRHHALFRWLDPDIRRRFGIADPIAERPIDMFFAGYKTPERTSFFINAASYLAEKNCFLAYSDPPASTRKLDSFTASLFPNYLGLAAQTKIVLTLHRYPVGYFEWERMVAQGFSNGALVIASRCLRSPFFEPGVHYLEMSTRNLDKVLKWVLDTSEGKDAAQAVATAAQTVMETMLTPERAGRFLLSFLADLDGA